MVSKSFVGDTLLKPSEIAKELRVSKSTVYGLLKSGQLKGYQINSSWRIPQKESLALFS